jgi:hypothetical protein
MFRVQEIGAVAYGGAVTLTEWWDNKRIEEGKITTKDVFKKASFYTYLVIGLAATSMSVFGWMRRLEPWTEKLATGFLYDLPRFGYNLAKSVSAERKSRSAESAAVREAQRIVSQPRTARQLPAGQSTSRSYQREFEKTAPFAY